MTKKQPPEDKDSQPNPVPSPGYPGPYVVYPEEEPIDWGAYWKILVEQKKLIGIVTGVCTLLGLLTAFIMTPIYRAEVLLAPVTQEKAGGLGALAGQFGDLASLAGINLGPGKDKTAEYVAALKSRALSVEFINNASLKPILFPGKWNGEKKRWKDKDEIPSDWKAFEMFDKDIRSVHVDRKTGLVTVAMEWKDPRHASIWANGLVKQVNSRLRSEAIQEAEKSISYLEQQLPQTSSVEVQQAIFRLIEAQTKKKMLASTREEYAFTTIDPAVPPERHARPKKLSVVAVGFLLGLLASVAFVLIRKSKES